MVLVRLQQVLLHLTGTEQLHIFLRFFVRTHSPLDVEEDNSTVLHHKIDHLEHKCKIFFDPLQLL